MPIATLQFNLPDEQNEYNLVCNASKMSLVLWHILEEILIKKIRYSEGLSEEHVKILEDMRDEILENMKDNGLSEDVFY
jgi:D-ribose pyranose/furanose isomerase RbsD